MSINLNDMFPSKLTPGIGVSLMIGAVGSLFLIFQSIKYVSKITQQRKRNRQSEENKCFTCKSLADKEPSESVSACAGCNQRKEKCSNGNQRGSGYECKKCEEDRIVHQKAGEWLLEQLKLRLRTPNDSGHNQNNETPQSISRIQRDKVREFVEELLSSMLNGPLDDVCVGQLYKSEKYIPLWNHECPGVAHVELKRLIQKIVDEVLNLPESLNLGGNHPPGRQQEEPLPYFDPKKYEELLATAVINKAINLFKNEKNVTENSSGIHTDSELDSNHNNKKELLTHQLTRNAANYFYSGESTPTSQPMSEFSLEKHDANVNYSSHNSQDYLNDYIQNHRVPLPEISSESNNDDDLQSVTSAGTDGTWEENWLFKKRKLKTDASVSIAMLVPSPTEDVKALIGDQNVDEVSDLSETESRNGDEEQLNSINGYSSLPAYSDSRLQPDSLISNHSLPEYEPLVTEAKNDLIFVGSRLTDLEPASAVRTMEDSETSSLTTNSGGENKYSEENNNIIETIELNVAATTTRVIETEPTTLSTESTGPQSDVDETNNNNNSTLVELNNVKNSVITTAELILAPPEEFQPIPAERTIIAQTEASEMASHTDSHNVETEKLDNHNDANNNESDLVYMKVRHTPTPDDINNANQTATAEDEEVVHLIPGSIAEREHLKWQNAEPMANNPYSSEALQRRLICGNTKPMDIHLVLDDNNQGSDPQGEDKENKTLQTAFSEDLTDYTRYGRDYYINDAKKASGTRKSMNDLKTFMDNDLTSDTDAANNVEVEQPAPAQKTQQEPPITATILPRSKTNNGATFLARPVQISDDSTVASPEDTNPQSMSPRPGSLTISEDSDTTRIYDLNTGETKIVHDNRRRSSLEQTAATPPTTPVASQSDSIESPIHNQMRKAVSEETLKFFSPKRPPKYTSNQKKFEEHHENIVKSFRRHSLDRQGSNEVTEKLVIEKEVIEALPSVKDLAKIYIHNDEQEAPLPKAKPKTFIVKENENDTPTEPKRTDVGKINMKAVAKNYDAGPTHKFKAGHSITARSISRSMREELKNTPTEPTISENEKTEKIEKPEKRHTSPERPPSPVLKPGNLRNSIAFFENLK